MDMLTISLIVMLFSTIICNIMMENKNQKYFSVIDTIAMIITFVILGLILISLTKLMFMESHTMETELWFNFLTNIFIFEVFADGLFIIYRSVYKIKKKNKKMILLGISLIALSAVMAPHMALWFSLLGIPYMTLTIISMFI